MDVAIVGYGPVGRLLAILLGTRGWRVRVLERWPEPYPLPRAVHFDHEVARILQGAGIMQALAGHTEPASLYEWRNAAGQVLLRIGRDSEQSLSGWPESTMVCQPVLEAALDTRVRSLASVHVELGAEVVALREVEDGVELLARSEQGGARAVRARFVVGCDGANSFVRSCMDVPTRDLGFAFDWLVVDVVPSEPRVFDPPNWQLCDPARPTTLVSGGPGRRRFEFMRLPHETLEELAQEATAWRLLAAWDVRPDNARLERHAVYAFRAQWSEQWRAGRLFLAGDAAHRMPPFAGQGMGSGLRDVANLAWKLDLVLAGRAPDALLDTYTRERLPHARTMIDLSIALGKVICVSDPAEAEARDRRMRAEEAGRGAPLVAPLPPLGPGPLSAGFPVAGRLFVQDRVRHGGASGLFDDVVGRGFVLLSPSGDPARALSPEFADFFASLGGLCVQVGADGPVADARGGYARWFAEHGVAVALQRPDYHLFGCAPTAGGAADLVAALRAGLAAGAAEGRA